MAKVQQEKNMVTHEIRNKDPKWKDYNDGEVRDSFKFGILSKKPFEESFFMFVADFQDNLREKYGASFEEIGRLLILMTYTKFRNHKDEHHYIRLSTQFSINNAQLSKIWKLNNQQTRSVKSIMKKKGLLGEDKEGLYISDGIMLKGSISSKEKQSLDYYTVYNKPIRDLYEVTTEYEVRDSAKYMGFFLSLVPFIKVSNKYKHKSDKDTGSNNTLVMSEWDNKKKRYKPLNKSTLCNHLGLSRPSLDKYMGGLNEKSKEITGMYLIYEVKPGGINRLDKTVMIINPMYTYSQGLQTKDYETISSWLNEIEDKQD